MDMDGQIWIGPWIHCGLREMFCQEGCMTLWNMLDHMTALMWDVARMLICFLCRIVIHINIVVADESNLFGKLMVGKKFRYA